MTQWSTRRRQTGGTIAFVPTMGFLHDGHLALMREGKRLCDALVVSIFVNPTQFGPGEDFESYPRNLERDFDLCRKTGADAVFTPAAADLYPEGFDTFILQEHLPNHLCGLSRPGHFQGVMTVVAKLFHIVLPDAAVFGEKDFQQLAVIRRMVRDLNFPIRIIGHPTVRESDGLAMSSRNARLSPEARKTARCLNVALKTAQDRLDRHMRSAPALIREAEAFISSHPDTRIDYIRICDPDTLEDIADIQGPALMALAVKIGGVRLIDNMTLTPKAS